MTIGENAVVTAKIRAASIIVAGTVDGEMTASGSIEIRPSARVSGNLTQGQQVTTHREVPRPNTAAQGLENHTTRSSRSASTLGLFGQSWM